MYDTTSHKNLSWSNGNLAAWSEAAITRDLADDIIRELNQTREPVHLAPTTLLAALNRTPRGAANEAGYDVHRLLSLQSDFVQAVLRIHHGIGSALNSQMDVYNGTLRAWPLYGQIFDGWQICC